MSDKLIGIDDKWEPIGNAIQRLEQENRELKEKLNKVEKEQQRVWKNYITAFWKKRTVEEICDFIYCGRKHYFGDIQYDGKGLATALVKFLEGVK